MMKLKTFTPDERKKILSYAITQQNVQITHKIIFMMAMDFCTAFFMHKNTPTCIDRLVLVHTTATHTLDEIHLQDHVRAVEQTIICFFQ